MPSTYTPIASVLVGSNTSTITISNIPQTYTDLVLDGSFTADTDNANLIWRFNGDTSTIYSQTLVGAAGTPTTGRETSQGRILVSWVTATPNSTSPATFIGNVMNYANTNVNKTALLRWNVLSATYPGVQGSTCLYRSTSGITQIDLTIISNNFTAGSRFTVYGIKAA